MIKRDVVMKLQKIKRFVLGCDFKKFPLFVYWELFIIMKHIVKYVF